MTNNLPTYIQVMRSIKEEIIAGILEPCQKIGSIKALAEKYKVNPNTVQRALAVLEEEGLLYSRRTAGKYVTDNLLLIRSIRYKEARKVTDEFVSKLDDLGVTPSELVSIFEEPEFSMIRAIS